MSADLRHIFISPETNEWSKTEDKKDWTESKSDNHERQSALGSIFGTIIQSAISFFTPKDEEAANISNPASHAHLCEVPHDNSKTNTLVDSSKHLHNKTSSEIPTLSSYMRPEDGAYKSCPKPHPSLTPAQRGSFVPSYAGSLQNYDPNSHPWSSSKSIGDGEAYTHQLPRKFASYQPLSSISLTQNSEYRKKITKQPPSNRNKPIDHSFDIYETNYPPSTASQSETRNYYQTNLKKHTANQTNSQNSSVINFIQNEDYLSSSRLSQGPLKNRIKRPFNYLSHTHESPNSRSFSEVRSDILPTKRMFTAPTSPSFTEISHKRMRGTHDKPYKNSYINSYINSKVDLRSRTSSVRSFSHLSNLPTTQNNTFLDMNKLPEPLLNAQTSFQEKKLEDEEHKRPTPIHTRTSQEFRFNFSLTHFLTCLDSFLSTFMLKEVIEKFSSDNELDPTYLSGRYIKPSESSTLGLTFNHEFSPFLNDRAGLLLNFYNKVLTIDKKSLGYMIKSSNKWNRLDCSYSRFTAQIHGFNRDEPGEFSTDSSQKPESSKDDTESTASDDIESISIDNTELLQDLQSLFPGSTPNSTCLDRFISILNHRKHMYAESPKELIFDTENNSLPIVSCTSSLKFPIWEYIDYQGFLKSQSSPIKELTWHFEKVLERLSWGATNCGRVILPIYGRLIGFLVIYDIHDKKTISFSIVNVSYPISEEERQDNTSRITALTSIIENNIKNFVYALNNELKLSLTMIPQRSSIMRENINIIEKTDLKISSTLTPGLGEDAGLNLFISLDSLYTGFQASLVDDSCRIIFRFLYQQSIFKYFS